MKELLEIIEARQQMMQEIGIANGSDKRLEDELNVALARFAEMQANVSRIDDLKCQLEAEQKRNDELRTMKWQIISNQLKQEPNLSE